MIERGISHLGNWPESFDYHTAERGGGIYRQNRFERMDYLGNRASFDL